SGTPGTSPANSTSGPGQNASFLEPFPTQASSNAFNYIFILITVAVVVLLIMILASLQVFQTCFKNCSSKGSQPRKDALIRNLSSPPSRLFP
uniref:Uncharacterized protein n=1 Tax=Laticauda laticaudata TaxID=8630 RepID=A0A8C5SBD3_LATLA